MCSDVISMAQLTDKRVFITVSSIATPLCACAITSRARKETHWTKASFDAFLWAAVHAAEPNFRLEARQIGFGNNKSERTERFKLPTFRFEARRLRVTGSFPLIFTPLSEDASIPFSV